MSNTTCNNISRITQVSPVKYYNDYNYNYYTYNYNHFELFLATIITLMPISKKYSQYITIDVMRRKINQYTNWNILMIIANSVLSVEIKPVSVPSTDFNNCCRGFW